jgi:AbrB family looped-hinge helix DNA binding protein
MTHRVGTKGQVVIPKAIRDALGIEPGDEVVFEISGHGVMIESAQRRRSLRGLLAGHDLVGALEADRRAEPR